MALPTDENAVHGDSYIQDTLTASLDQDEHTITAFARNIDADAQLEKIQHFFTVGEYNMEHVYPKQIEERQAALAATKEELGRLRHQARHILNGATGIEAVNAIKETLRSRLYVLEDKCRRRNADILKAKLLRQFNQDLSTMTDELKRMVRSAYEGSYRLFEDEAEQLTRKRELQIQHLTLEAKRLRDKVSEQRELAEQAFAIKEEGGRLSNEVKEQRVVIEAIRSELEMSWERVSELTEIAKRLHTRSDAIDAIGAIDERLSLLRGEAKEAKLSADDLRTVVSASADDLLTAVSASDASVEAIREQIQALRITTE